MGRFQISDGGQREEPRGAAAVAVIFIVLANLMLFGVLAAVLLPRSEAGAKTEAARAPAAAMLMSTPSTARAPATSISPEAIPAPPAAALARPSVAPGGSSLVLARSAPRVPRICPHLDRRRVSIAQYTS